MGSFLSTLMNCRNSITITPHPFMDQSRDPQMVTVPGTETETTTAVYRQTSTSDEATYQKLVKEYATNKNCVQVMEERCRLMGARPALAYRSITKIEKRQVPDSDGTQRTLDYYHFSERCEVSYAEMWRYIISFGSGLRELGLAERSPITIYEETRWEWIISIFGIWTHNMLATTVYANLGEDALAYALLETQSAAIICSGRVLNTLIPLLQDQKLNPIIIYLDSTPAGIDTEGFRVVAWNDVVKRGEAAKCPANIPTDNDLEGLVMYTSGTTGNPKGVVHSHGSVVAGIRALDHRLSDIYTINAEDEVYCAYLPLAHILEFGIVNLFLMRGSMVGFGNPRTLTDDHAVPHGDFQEYKPMIIIGVPRIFDTIKKGVEKKLPPPGSVKRSVFDKAYNTRLDAIMNGKETPYWNRVVFKDGRQAIGGRIYSMLSGGGPLSKETQQFVDVCFGGPILIQGWGLTETVCCGTTQRLSYIEMDDVGQPLASAELRLLDVEGYKHTDKPEPRGEILIRGPFLFKGYYKQEQLTRDAIDADGWFHTGDVGSIGPNGTLRVIGRVKALAKNVLGEYIAMEALESIYGQNSLCTVCGVCVLVHPARTYVTALVLTGSTQALEFAKDHGIDGTYEELLQNPTFHAKAAESLAETAKRAGRKPFELVKAVRVLDDVWTPENGLATPTAKLRRSKIEEHYADVITELFAKQ
ncbi:putative fatty acyl CoA synthetase 2 [Trypanosoma grayi]|uniref:putative fatty acyl CoA synthetase 2 n=1 Tax=Trypanosoma grayi TaxID=71804 RepID=UPI0004F495C3|nr:putative fatty acyl CoA synthetase 2 [Trypanosoma grayi]KEG07112.1 putative fatty acyl CoA synthetase 2 [Trypanosoma grayi]